jgi:PTS system mannose-specific IID component
MGGVKAPLGAAFLRLFMVQCSWNYERLLGIGMGVAEEPLLRDLRDAPDGGASYRAAVARGARFFNAHPYLCGLAVGATARAEHDGMPPTQVERLRAALIGPLGSLGDRLVWAGWLPLLAGGALAAITFGAGWIAVAAFLAIYNVGHIALRWWTLQAGWHAGPSVAGALRHPLLQGSLALVGPAMAFVVGAGLPLVVRWLARPLAGTGVLVLLATAALAVGALRARPDLISGPRLGIAAVCAAVLVGVLWR